MNNKVLLIVLAVLLAVFLFSKFFTGSETRSFDPEIIKVETEQVTKVVLNSKADNLEKAVLEKNGNAWTISTGSTVYQAATESVNNLLTNLATVKTSFIAAKSADKWPEYELENDKASHVVIYGGDKVLSDFYVGKFSVNQQAQQITSFFRLADKDDVYAVQGMAGMMLGQGSASYRDKQVLKLDFKNIEMLNYEGDAVYSVNKSGDNWNVNDGSQADTTKLKNFLMNLVSMSGDSFADGFDENLNSGNLLKKLTISGNNMPEPVIVRCWTNDGGEQPFVIQSSQYPQSYFTSDSTRLFTRIFKPMSDW